MSNPSNLTTQFANNITIATKIIFCYPIADVNKTIDDLFSLYSSNISRNISSLFLNVTIPSYDCLSGPSKYFEQLITFTQAVPIRIQVAVASLYYDYIVNNSFLLNGFNIGREGTFNLSSITLNYSAQYDACASGDVAMDPLCPLNSFTPVCFEPTPNPWIFNCSRFTTTSTTTVSSTTSLTETIKATVAPTLETWAISLICVFGLLFLLILIGGVIYGIRRYSHTRRVANLNEYLLRDEKSMKKSGIPQGQAFQRAATIVAPKRAPVKPISRIQEGTAYGPQSTVVNYNTIKLLGYPPPGTFVQHTKIQEPTFPSRSPASTPPSAGTSNPVIPKSYITTVVSRPVSGTSVNQLRSITDGLSEQSLNESDSISLDRPNSGNPRKPGTPVSRQMINGSFVEESLHDEDAWMPILAVANAELDVLNRLENEQSPIKTLV